MILQQVESMKDNGKSTSAEKFGYVMISFIGIAVIVGLLISTMHAVSAEPNNILNEWVGVLSEAEISEIDISDGKNNKVISITDEGKINEFIELLSVFGDGSKSCEAYKSTYNEYFIYFRIITSDGEKYDGIVGDNKIVFTYKQKTYSFIPDDGKILSYLKKNY